MDGHTIRSKLQANFATGNKVNCFAIIDVAIKIASFAQRFLRFKLKNSESRFQGKKF